jgi:hypothetical protein
MFISSCSKFGAHERFAHARVYNLQRHAGGCIGDVFHCVAAMFREKGRTMDVTRGMRNAYAVIVSSMPVKRRSLVNVSSGRRRQTLCIHAMPIHATPTRQSNGVDQSISFNVTV